VRGWLRAITPRRWRSGVAIVPVVRLAGVIGFSTPLRPGLTLFGIARILDKAFKQKGIKAIALVINSPGGSAVQSHLIYQRIRQMAAEKKVPVIAFVEDVAASGGYMIACAAEEIVADASSIVGSIGVVGASTRRSSGSASSAASIRRASTKSCSIRSSRKTPRMWSACAPSRR
jgi:serine protease SohB